MFLSQEVTKTILKIPPSKTIQYSDKELKGFFLEYRPSDKGYDTLDIVMLTKKTHYFRIGNTNSMDAPLAREMYIVFFQLIEKVMPHTKKQVLHKKCSP